MGGMGEVMLRSAGMSLEFSKWLLPGLSHFFLENPTWMFQEFRINGWDQWVSYNLLINGIY